MYLRPLDNLNHRHVCRLALLLIHTLRHGLVCGATVDQVLQHAIDPADRKVTQLFPIRSVL